jgi:hypothetical protein
VLPQSVDIGVVGKVGLESPVLRFEYKWAPFGVEENFSGRPTSDGEGKRGVDVMELDISFWGSYFAVCWSGEDLGWNFVSGICGISYFEVDSGG